MKKFFRYALLGVLIGSLTFLVILSFTGPTTVTPKEIISVLLMSAGIGLVSSIFEIEWNMLLEVVIHFILTFSLVVLTGGYNNWLSKLSINTLASFGIFVLIYVAIWVGLYVVQLVDMKRLNQKIKLRNQKK